MAIDLQLTNTAMQCALLNGAIKLLALGQHRASAADMLAQSGLEGISNVVAGKAIAGLGLPYTSPGNRKVYTLDLATIEALQERTIPDAPAAALSIPDLSPEIAKVVSKIAWLNGQVEDLRTKQNNMQLESAELRRLTALNLDSFDHQIERDRNRTEIRRLRGIEHYIEETNEALAAMPSFEQLEADARTAGLALQAATAEMEQRKAKIKVDERQTQTMNQAFRGITVGPRTPSEPRHQVAAPVATPTPVETPAPEYKEPFNLGLFIVKKLFGA